MVDRYFKFRIDNGIIFSITIKEKVEKNKKDFTMNGRFEKEDWILYSLMAAFKYASPDVFCEYFERFFSKLTELIIIDECDSEKDKRKIFRYFLDEINDTTKNSSISQISFSKGYKAYKRCEMKTFLNN